MGSFFRRQSRIRCQGGYHRGRQSRGRPGTGTHSTGSKPFGRRDAPSACWCPTFPDGSSAILGSCRLGSAGRRAGVFPGPHRPSGSRSEAALRRWLTQAERVLRRAVQHREWVENVVETCGPAARLVGTGGPTSTGGRPSGRRTGSRTARARARLIGWDPAGPAAPRGLGGGRPHASIGTHRRGLLCKIHHWDGDHGSAGPSQTATLSPQLVRAHGRVPQTICTEIAKRPSLVFLLRAPADRDRRFRLIATTH